MFKKLLFLLILGGIGFGIYTGISKIVQIINAPEAPTAVVAVVETGTQIVVSSDTGLVETGFSTGMVEATGTIVVIATGTTTTGEQTTTNTPGFFARIWTTIKSWFCSDTVEVVTAIETGNVASGVQTLLSGTDINSGSIASGDSIEEDSETLSGSLETDDAPKMTTGKIVIPSTQTVTKTGVVKKPTTTTKPVTTSKSDRDPLLDALFK